MRGELTFWESEYKTANEELSTLRAELNKVHRFLSDKEGAAHYAREKIREEAHGGLKVH